MPAHHMSLSDFFTPIDLKQLIPKNGYYASHLGEKIAHFSVDFPDLDKKTDIAIIGVQDDRNAVNNPGCALGPDYVREKLYQLFEGCYKTKIVDLGNIRQGASITDTYFAVKTVVNELVKMNILPV
ncbi:MAG: arginase family protein, partial [Mucilaginibacter sp.]